MTRRELLRLINVEMSPGESNEQVLYPRVEHEDIGMMRSFRVT